MADGASYAQVSTKSMQQNGWTISESYPQWTKSTGGEVTGLVKDWLIPCFWYKGVITNWKETVVLVRWDQGSNLGGVWDNRSPADWMLAHKLAQITS